MAKIKINKLPQGFELVDGKVKRISKKRDGGYVTGDQADYGLVTTPQEYYGQTNFNNNEDNDVRYSLSRVPREDANVEAEGGETVLADLNSNGQFGLYDIKGPRHTSGGVPMFLPEQSFIYSDTAALKFNKDEMAEFGIESGKRKTPATISKKYPLNPYLGAINDQYADDISTLSAELMLKKNMNNLSKLAYGQELKKKFEDGVPLAAYPFLDSKGIDPLEFTAQVEEISKKQAEINAIASLPPDQQQAIMMLQEILAQAEQQASNNMDMSSGPQAGSPGQEQLTMANNQLGQDLMAQRGGQTASSYAKEQGLGWPQDVKDPVFNKKTKEWEFDDGTPSLSKKEATKLFSDFNSGQPIEDQYKITVSEEVTGNDVSANIETNVTEGKFINPLPKKHEQYQAFEDAIARGNVQKIVPNYNPSKRKTEYTLIEIVPNPLDAQPELVMVDSADTSAGTGDMINIYDEDQEKIMGVIEGFPDAKFRRGIYSSLQRRENQAGAGSNSYGYDLSGEEAAKDFELRWGDAWKGGQFEGANGEMITIPPVEGFDYSLSKDDPKYKEQWTAVQNNMQAIDNAFSAKHGLTPRDIFAGQRKGEKVDGLLGLHTHSIDRRYLGKPGSNELTASLEDPINAIPGFTPPPAIPPKPEPWLQDVLNINAQNQLENPLILPVRPKLPRQKIDYVLDDWTGKVNNINAALNSKLQQLGAFAGRSGVMGADIGKAVELSENAINTTNLNNVGIVNQTAAQQARLDMENNLQNLKLRMDEDDGTNLALQRFTDFKNWDTTKSAELMNSLITNQANTYNLNRTKKPQYVIDPTTGGLSTWTGDSRAFAQADQTSEEEKRRDKIFETWNWLDTRGIQDDDKDNYMKYILGDYTKNDTDDDEFEQYAGPPSVVSKNPPNSYFNPAANVETRRGREVKKLKKSAYPYWMSVGKMGR